jgi:predicted RNA methylase
MPVKIDKDALDVLVRSRVDGIVLYLPSEKLDRNLYVKVNKALESIGGKWNRGKKGHVFDLSVDVEELLDGLINNGEYVDVKKEFQFFETPDELAKELVEWAEIKDHHKALEPEAGKGRILRHILSKTKYVSAVELNRDNFDYLCEDFKCINIWNKDFLKICDESDFPQEYDRIIMNPPFHKGEDVKHIFQAWDLLAKGGILVSVVSESPFFRENKLSQEFRRWLDENKADVKSLEAGAFSSSGTNVKTRIIKVRKM